MCEKCNFFIQSQLRISFYCSLGLHVCRVCGIFWWNLRPAFKKNFVLGKIMSLRSVQKANLSTESQLNVSFYCSLDCKLRVFLLKKNLITTAWSIYPDLSDVTHLTFLFFQHSRQIFGFDINAFDSKFNGSLFQSKF